MLVVFPFILIFSWVGKKRGGNLVYAACRSWAFLWYTFIFIRHKKIYASPHDEHKRYIFVANHTSYIDIPQLLRATRQPVRVLGRHDLAKVPVFGTIYKAAAILVDRSSRENRAKSLTSMKNVLDEGISIFIFPEGTFNESEEPLKHFYDGAFKLAIDTGVSIKPIIFPDTTRRLNHKSIFSFTPGICRSVYLEEIKPNTDSASGMAELKQTVFERMQTALLYYRKSS